MHVSPDLDSILYALAGLNDEERGWGRVGETWHALETVTDARRRGLVPARRQRPRAASRAHAGAARGRAALGGDGADLRRRSASRRAAARDRRPAAHVDRHRRRRVPVSGVVRRARASRRGRTRVRFEGAEAAAPAPGVLEAIDAADLLLIAPSNPYVSIAPILAVAGDPRRARARAASRASRSARSSAASAVKGPPTACWRAWPAARRPGMSRRCYAGLIDSLVVDEADADDLDGLGDVEPVVARTLMSDESARRRLAEATSRSGATRPRAKSACVSGYSVFPRRADLPELHEGDDLAAHDPRPRRARGRTTSSSSRRRRSRRSRDASSGSTISSRPSGRARSRATTRIRAASRRSSARRRASCGLRAAARDLRDACTASSARRRASTRRTRPSPAR